jgi:hypothetical protein
MMNRKAITIGLSALVFMMTMMPSLCGGPTDTLVVYITNDASADILVTNHTGGDATWYPAAGIGETEESPSPDFYNCTNEGSVQVDVEIKAEVTEGTWSLGSAAGHDTLYLAYNNTQTTEWTEIKITDDGFTLDMAHDGYEPFALKISMPTSTSVSADHEVTITFTATAD